MPKIMRVPEPSTQMLMIINQLECVERKINRLNVLLDKWISIKFRLLGIKAQLQQQLDADSPPSGVIIGAVKRTKIDTTILKEFH